MEKPAWPLLVGFFLYNAIFLFGFTNYLFGVGVLLWAVAAWVAMAGWDWRARVLVGRKAPLHLLRFEWQQHGLSS